MPSTELTQSDTAELIELYHLARTALAGSATPVTPHARMCWASRQWKAERAGAGIPSARAYKALCRALNR